MKKLAIISALVIAFHPMLAQQLEDSIRRNRLNTFLIGAGVAYTATLIALNQAWYADHPKEEFHFFNDGDEWKQMDKLGHVYSTFQFSHATSRAFQWTGMNERKAAVWGSVMGFALMLPIELMDGYSSEYGASGSDLIANALGSGLYLGQALLWNEVRLHPKFSYSESGVAKYRSDVLGNSGSERMLKDYNGQTYWLGFDLYRLAGFRPKWLNLAVGYGVNNMVNALGNPTSSFPLQAYRQYYLAVDFNLTHFKSKSKVVNTLIHFVNLIHLPAPALEYTSKGDWVFHPIHF